MSCSFKNLGHKNFADEEDDKEIQIGFPTDVKHLAHIGCEDAKANAPSWVQFKFDILHKIKNLINC